MSSPQTATQKVIAIDCDQEHSPLDIHTAWQDEITRRLDEVRSGRVQTIPAEQAESMIRDDAPPA